MRLKARIREIEKPEYEYEITTLGGVMTKGGVRTVRATVDIYLPDRDPERTHALADLLLREGARMVVSIKDMEK